MSKYEGLVFEGFSPRTPLGAAAPAASLPDMSRYGNDGVFTNAPTWTQLPSGLWYPDFNGAANVVTITHDSSLTFNGDFSILLWVNFLGAPAEYLISKGVGINTVQSYSLLTTAGPLVNFQMGDLAMTGLYLQHTSDDTISGWTHIGVSLLGTASTMLLNGVIQTGAAAAGVRTTNTDNLLIGVRGDGFGEWTGGATLVRLFNYPLSTDQINAIFAAERTLFGV